MTKLLLARVAILTSIIFSAVSILNAEQTENNRLPDSVLISNIINKFVGPYVKSFGLSLKDTNFTKKAHETAIEKEIKKKIDTLKPVLDENSIKENIGNDSEEDAGDTKIIEFSPFPDENKNILRDKITDPGPVKEHFKKYKKLQKKVHEVLEKETISDKAKTLVTKTLKELIDELMSSQCTWRNRAEKSELRSQGNLLKMDRNAMIDSWRKKWEELIDRYSSATKNKEADGSDYKEVFIFLLRLREFFFEIHDELNTLNGLYKVKCQVVDRNNKLEHGSKKFKVVSDGESLRQRPKGDDSCENVKICTGELKTFLSDYYINIMETVDTVFKNYGEMYIRDVNTVSSKEKRTFVSLLKEINKAVDEKTGKAFNKEIDKLVLDVNNSTKATVSAIKKLIKSTSVEVQKLIDATLKEELKPLEAKMRLTVRKDISTTMGIEVDNLESIYRNKMCTIFQTCNYNITRRFIIPTKIKTDDTDTVFVKLHLGLDGMDPFRRSGVSVPKMIGVDGVEPSRRLAGILKMKREGNRHATGHNRYQMSSSKTTFDPEKYLFNYTVTRTTFYVPMRENTENAKTTIGERER